MPIDPLSAVGTALAVGGSIAQGIGQKKQNELQRQWASEEAEKAYARNIEQWQRENAYNDPSAQMARLKAAGLNPNMVYGTGGAKTVSAPSPRKEAPKGQFVNPLGQLNPLALANASVAQQQARSIQLQNMKDEIDLGITNVPFDTESQKEVTVQNEDGTFETKFYMVKDTKNMYYKRQRDKTLQQGYQTNIDKFKSGLADEGFTINDPAILRFLQTGMKKRNLNLSEVTADIIDDILRSFGIFQKARK